MVVPWNAIGPSLGYDWRFMRGSLKWSDPGRVKLLRDHDTTKATGKALSIEDREDGLYVVFSVARGPEGDALLSLAEDGVYDGFSIGPLFGQDDYTVAADGVRDVHNARLVEVTATAVPAFDDARITKVAAMAGQEKTVATETKPDDVALVAFKAEVDTKFSALIDGVKASAEEQQKSLAAAFGAAVQGAFSTVGGQARPQVAVLTEPPVYGFNGDSMQPSMIKDAFQFHIERNMEAGDRLRKFDAQQQEMKRLAFANNVGNSAQVIPPQYRPDLFVADVEKGRPLHSLVSHGTVANGNPFTVPIYDSATGMVGNHTEGVNPTSGTIVFDSTIVDPSAISGSFVLTRELVDSANPAVDAIALGVMREEWARQTEAKLHTAFLAAVDPKAPFNAADPQPQLRSELATYPFVRFAAPTGAAMSQAATLALATAEDTTGRPLFPSVGAENSAGIGNAVSGGWYVDGLPFLPAYSVLGDAGTAADLESAEVIILNSADVWAWESSMLTFRFEEKLGPANIELALFGYYGAAVLRPSGVVMLGTEAV